MAETGELPPPEEAQAVARTTSGMLAKRMCIVDIFNGIRCNGRLSSAPAHSGAGRALKTRYATVPEYDRSQA